MKKLSLLLILVLLISGCASSQTSYVHPEVPSVYYEIFVASYYDSNGDGMGDLDGVREKLPYIQETLGISNVWFMPVMPSPSYHKYDVTDYKTIDPQYGDMESMKNLLTAMESRNMTLILDLVLNHTSIEHPWFTQAVAAKQTNTCDTNKYCDYYNFSDTWQTGYREYAPGIWYESVFSEHMPDLNLDSSEVRREISEIVAFWLDMGIKGFRLDATSHYYADDVARNNEFLDWLNTEVKTHTKDAYIVAEAWIPNAIVTDMYASNIDSFFNFGLSQANGMIAKSVKKGDGQSLAQFVAEYNQAIKANNENALDAPFISNHDQGRSATYFNDVDQQKMAASLYLMMPGNPFVYYGEEIGMKGSGVDENKRLPMVWSQKDATGQTKAPQNADYTVPFDSSVADQEKDKASLLNHYAHAIKIRNKYPQLVTSSPTVVTSSATLYVMKHDDITVIHNLSQESQILPGSYSVLDTIQGAAKASSDGLQIEGMSSIIVRDK